MPCDLFALMRQASRRVAAEHEGAILIQAAGSWRDGMNPLVDCPALTFYFRVFAGDDGESSAELKYADGKWGDVQASPPVFGARLNSLLRCEINLLIAQILVRAAGYMDSLDQFSLLQPVTGEMPPHPRYAFPIDAKHLFVFVDAVTGEVTSQMQS